MNHKSNILTYQITVNNKWGRGDRTLDGVYFIKSICVLNFVGGSLELH